MKIAILGAGALGCYYGARLQEGGHDVSFIMRSAYQKVQETGLTISSVHGDINLPHVQVYQDSKEVGAVDLVIVAWKTTANAQLATLLPPLLAPHTKVVTLQNGMGNAEAISAFHPKDHIFIGLCFVCIMQSEAGKIKHLEGGEINFAPLVSSPQGFKDAEELAQLFAQCNITTKPYDIAEKIQWFKLIWNIPFNGLCLLHKGINMGQLEQLPGQIDRACGIMKEIIAAAAKRGYTIDPKIIDIHLKRNAKMHDFVPSSAVDYQQGRPIEFNAIWGIPLQRAKAAGATTPLWDQLNEDLKQLLNIR